MNIRLRTDASAAKGIATRRGLGKVRHIEVNQLWLQEKVNNGEIQVMKVKGEGNLADGLTKPLEGPGVKKHVALTRQEIVEGRSVLTPEFETAEDRNLEEEDPEDESEVHKVECDQINQWPAGVAILELLSLNKLFVPCSHPW